MWVRHSCLPACHQTVPWKRSRGRRPLPTAEGKVAQVGDAGQGDSNLYRKHSGLEAKPPPEPLPSGLPRPVGISVRTQPLSHSTGTLPITCHIRK